MPDSHNNNNRQDYHHSDLMTVQSWYLVPFQIPSAAYKLNRFTIYWFKSYLSDRTQYVEYNGVASAKKLIETGVPQVSIFGPLLYVIYMNDIQTVSERLNFILYADDTTLTSTLCTFTHEINHDVNHMSYLINLELSKISDWLAVNKLSLNVDKTKFMIFHNHQKVIPTHDIPC